MNKVMEALKALAAVDKQLVRLKKMLDAGPLELQKLQEMVDYAKLERTAVEAGVRDCAGEVDRANLEIKTLEGEANDLQRKIGIIKNTKEYQVITDRVGEVKRLIAAHEGRALEIMEKMEALRKELALKQGELTSAEQVLSAKKTELDKEAGDIKVQQQVLAAERKEKIDAVRKLDSDSLATYSNALKRGKGQALADLKGDICQACHRKIQINLVNLLLTGTTPEKSVCPGCGRILFCVEDA